jgi:NAD(P)H-dependent FMN reductase
MSADRPRPTRLLTLCGSLQRRSANRAALDAARAVAAAAGATVVDFRRLAELPAFDADLAAEPIEVVQEWRGLVRAADALLVAAPEYAGALAGAVKNAFDWLVGSGELYRKPVAALSAGTSGGEHARRMLAQTLTWQGAYVVAELGISAARTKLDEGGEVVDEATNAAIASVTRALLDAERLPSAELVTLASGVVDALGIDAGHVAPAV